MTAGPGGTSTSIIDLLEKAIKRLSFQHSKGFTGKRLLSAPAPIPHLKSSLLAHV
jgi:hypothetical protein